ncbi:MAG: enoyl-CoA hydratase/isomerase family protein [Candidatus Acidiferrales bacterium]
MATRLVSKIQNDILVIRLEADDGYPRLEFRVLDALEREMERLGAEDALRGGVITGTERAFAAGAEISELASLGRAEGFEFARRGQRVMGSLARSPKRVVAAVRGYCFGGGLDLALACSARMATQDAAFAHPGGALGIITGWGGTQRLPALIGKARAVEMFVTGRRVETSEALKWGLISNVVDAADLIANAVEQARAPSQI